MQGRRQVRKSGGWGALQLHAKHAENFRQLIIHNTTIYLRVLFLYLVKLSPSRRQLPHQSKPDREDFGSRYVQTYTRGKNDDFRRHHGKETSGHAPLNCA